MRKTNFLLLLKTILGRGGIQLLMIAIVVGVIFTAQSEMQLYNSQALLVETSTKPVLTEPINTSTKEISHSPTPTSQKNETTTVTGTKTSSPTTTVSKTSSKTSPTTELSITTIVCGPPQDWMQYLVQAEDNLYRISLKFRTSVSALKIANCMGSSTVIVRGENLWVPNVATSTPISTYTPAIGSTKSIAETPSSTPTPSVEPTLTQTVGIIQTKTNP